MKYLKILFCACLLVILYLFALNGRYEFGDGILVKDKWTKTIIQADVKLKD